ncbi:MAG TPA: asparagine synthase (glutamine-hydrolyzing) [Actinomycetota bacterium]|nr:asparagine synthase (glutamine-hydrolyzing) [Actinomycetota bacterium]
MCGICGTIGRDPRQPGGSVSSMQRSLRHRGPDGDGSFRAPHVALAMTRLSIIDVDGGWQPLYDEDRLLAVVANGEIYNFVELRRELEARGHRFRTRSDCETIVHLYEEHGDRCVEHLRGMFAFALWDERRRRLLLARDRMGEKPLYVHRTPGRVTFASELKALLASGDVRVELDPGAVDLFFHYQFVPEPGTPLRGVAKLPAGHVMTIDVDPWRVEQRCYWRMEDAPPLDGDPAEVVRAELETVAELTTRSDVPTAVALSGGLDSSAVAALAARGSTRPAHAFSVGYEGRPPSDERSEARVLADVLDMEFHDIELTTAEVVESFPSLVRAWGDPIADMAGFGYRAIARATRAQGIPVLLQGQGGDELMWGYPWVRRGLAASTLRAAAWAGSPAPAWRYLDGASALDCGAMEDPESHSLRSRARAAWRQSRRDRTSPHGRLVFYDLHPDFQAARAASQSLYARDFDAAVDHQRALSLFTVPPPWDRLDLTITRLISDIYLLENGIAQGDRISMSSSVELRLPLVDYRLVEVVVGLRKRTPDHTRRPKAWLREAVRDLLPDGVLARKKRPFLPPVRAWHRALFDAYGPWLADGYLVGNGILRPAAARSLAAGAFPDGAGSPLSFKALVLELWCRTFASASTQQGSAAPLVSSGAA